MSKQSLSKDSLNTLSSLEAGGKTYHYYSLPKAADTLGNIDKLPFSLKVLLENLLRNEDDATVISAPMHPARYGNLFTY